MTFFAGTLVIRHVAGVGVVDITFKTLYVTPYSVCCAAYLTKTLYPHDSSLRESVNGIVVFALAK
jgi:hypothetical protein